ncbi:MAG: 2'-5' RNA ligase family protein [Chloroflexota bacterium]
MKTVTSITIAPPFAVQKIAIPLLWQHTYDVVRRLPAHISVLYPFVPEPDLPTATDHLRDLCAAIEPFDITVAGYGEFPQVTYLQIEPSDELNALMQQVHAAFPQCDPYHGTFGKEPPPTHITVAVFNSKNKQRQATFPDYEPVTFTVDRLHVNLGAENRILTWLVRDVVMLGG